MRLEHGLDLDDASIAQMVKQGTWYVPTFTVYYYNEAPAGTPEAKRDELRVALHGPSFQRALKAGVRIAFGTDVGGFPWTDPIAQEFGYLVKFGMTPMQAIQSATSKAADLLDMQGQIGVIAPGAYADIIAVAGDPLRDVNVLKDVRFVMKDGKVFKNTGAPD
jgi:imidazolonepropionase-like amidohydrolase